MKDVPVDRKRMEECYEIFNTGNVETIATWYTDDVVLEFRDITLNGKNAVIGHFKEFFHTVREEITPLQIFGNNPNIAVEVSDKLTA
jgi:ketosteroid isomerase-like protein